MALDNIENMQRIEEWRKFLCSKLGWTDLHMAAATDQVETIGFLLDGGAANEASDKAGMTPLHVAAVGAHVGAIELLLARGARIEAQHENGRTPLHWAASAGKVTENSIEDSYYIF